MCSVEVLFVIVIIIINLLGRVIWMKIIFKGVLKCVSVMYFSCDGVMLVSFYKLKDVSWFFVISCFLL